MAVINVNPVVITADPGAVQRAMEAIEVAPVEHEEWYEDDGYAEDDHTSRWIERVGEAEFV
jgi:hypothetical protein